MEASGGLVVSPPPAAAPRNFNYPKATKAVNYLEDKGIRRTLSEMTKALLEQRPDDVIAFMINYLRDGTAPKPVGFHSDSGVPKADSPTGVACAFLELHRTLQRDAVRQLVDLAAPSFHGSMGFYSAPGGRGRHVRVRGSEHLEDSFVLVTSNDAFRAPGSVATDGQAEIMRSAMAEGVAVSENMVAATVRTSAGLEGILLAELPAGDFNFGSASCTYSTFALMPMVRLWSLLLAERMEALFWRLDAQEARATLHCMQQNLNDIVERQDDEFDIEHAKTVASLPQQVLQGCLTADRVALWVYDQNNNELVLNNSGHLEGSRVNASTSVVGEVITNGGHPIYMDNVEDAGRTPRRLSSGQVVVEPVSCLSVPVAFPCSMSDDGLAVIQFIVSKEACKSLTHFDLAHAERLSKSCLPTMLQVRQRFLQMIRNSRERHHLELVRDALNQSAKVIDVVAVVEDKVPCLLECERTTLFFVDEEKGQIWAPPSKHVQKGIMVNINEGLVGHVVRLGNQASATGEQDCSLIINNPQSCPYWKGDVDPSFVTRNIIAIPVFSGGQDKRKVVAVVQVLNKLMHEVAPEVCIDETHTSAFSQNDVKLLRPLAKLISLHLHRLTLDMMWSRALMEGGMDLGGVDSLQQVARPLIVEEYFASQVANTVTQVQLYSTGTGFHQRRSATEDGQEEKLAVVPELSNAPEWAQVEQWRVDYWSLSEAQEFHLLRRALQLSGTPVDDTGSKVPVQSGALYNFFLAVKANYRDNPYHNFQHAMSTVHYAFLIMEKSGLLKILKPTDVFASIVGSLCHDIDHRGRNTQFEVATRSELALRYNDVSPLENHSAARMFEIAWNHKEKGNDCNIFRGFSADSYNHVRQRIVCGIIATDMKFHGDHVKLLGNFKMAPPSASGDYPDEQLQFLVELVVHSADIANPCMPADISAKWGDLIAKEFGQQTAHERELGLPVTAFMDGLEDKKAAAKSSIGFMNFVVQPYITPIISHFPGIAEMKKNLDQNRAALEATRDS